MWHLPPNINPPPPHPTHNHHHHPPKDLVIFIFLFSKIEVPLHVLLCSQEMTGEYEEKKAAYENLAAGLESNMSKLEQVSHSVGFDIPSNWPSGRGIRTLVLKVAYGSEEEVYHSEKLAIGNWIGVWYTFKLTLGYRGIRTLALKVAYGSEENIYITQKNWQLENRLFSACLTCEKCAQKKTGHRYPGTESVSVMLCARTIFLPFLGKYTVAEALEKVTWPWMSVFRELRTPLTLDCVSDWAQQEVRALREELAHEESRYHYLQCMLKVRLSHDERLASLPYKYDIDHKCVPLVLHGAIQWSSERVPHGHGKSWNLKFGFQAWKSHGI